MPRPNCMKKNIPLNTSTANENYISPISIVRLLCYTKHKKSKKKKQESNNWNLEVRGSNNGTHFTQREKRLNYTFHYESSMKLNDRMFEWFFKRMVF